MSYMTPNQALASAIPFGIVTAIIIYHKTKSVTHFITGSWVCILLGLLLTGIGMNVSGVPGLWWHASALWVQGIGAGWLVGSLMKRRKLLAAKTAEE